MKVEVSRVHDSSWYAERIGESWRSTVQGIIETGKRIAEAKAALPHGEFLQMVESRLPFGKYTARRLLAVGADKRFLKGEHVPLLPASWGTLYAITRLDDPTFDRALSDGIIRPDVQRHEITRLLKQPSSTPTEDVLYTSMDGLVDSGQQFGVIYADPPWQYGNQGTRAATDNHYPTMPLDDICALPVQSLAAEQSHLHLWTTNAFLFDAQRVIEAWGFTYKSVLVWVKPQMGIGNYWRVSHEFLLLGVRGGCSFRERNHMSWLETERTKHSAKPEQVRTMIESVSPEPRLEMFARVATPGWTVWGNEVERMFHSDHRSV